MHLERPQFESVRTYGSCFTDVSFWQPYVEEVCKRHGLETDAGIRTGLPGTHPVFLIGNRWVIKFFSELFDGDRSFAVERDVYALLGQLADFPSSRYVAEGALFSPEEGWRWPYLISTLLPGKSLGEVYAQVSKADKEAIAADLGYLLRRLHSISLENATTLRADWEPFAGWLTDQRSLCVENHRRWQSLPPHLIDQLDTYLPESDVVLSRSTKPLLLHCDLNADHLLGALHERRWTSYGIIDFGDAKVGDIHYELVALHLGLFHCDKGLLRLFLAAYGSDIALHPHFARRAMSFTLLHECNVLDSLFERFPALQSTKTLAELADWLWDCT